MEIENATRYFSSLDGDAFYAEDEEDIVKGINCLEDLLFSTKNSETKDRIQNIANRYSLKIIQLARKEFSGLRPPVETRFNYILRLLQIFSENELGILFDFDKAYWEMFNISFSSLGNAKMSDRDINNSRNILKRLEESIGANQMNLRKE